jgi:hypothetical protein
MVVAALSVVTLSVAAFLFNSETAAQKAVDWYIANHAGGSGIRIELAGFSGSLAKGFKFSKLGISQLNPPLQLQVFDASARADFSRILTGSKLLLSLELARLDLVGMTASPIASSSVPDYHSFACFAGMPVNIEIASLAIGHATLKPFHDFPLQIDIASFSLQPGNGSGCSLLQADFTADLREKTVGKGRFNGVAKQQQQKVEGSLELQMFGQKILTELSLAQRRGCPEVSGYISSTTLDIAKISHWLIPLWQETFPFGFDGSVDCSGSWLFNREIGFLGNLSGRCNNLRMVAQGLFITLFELNGNWKLFDGNFSFSDDGSLFFGFPASLSGKVETVLQPSRKWDMDFSCMTIDFSRLTTDLPWGVKYGMALPPLSGGATFSVQLRGARPEISARLNTDDLIAGKKSEKRSVTGAITYHLGPEGPGNLGIDMTCLSEHRPPPIFTRFKNGAGRLDNYISDWHGPYIWRYSLQGSDSANLSFKGALSANERNIDTNGHWHDGMGTIQTFLDQNLFVAGNIQVLDLLLAN